ncbi:conserved exported hypothetical protein [Candidatus Terasakiella magnetica]|uniref:Uncharacterized protein n=1 Tax=Candidatus Terasakiella magnetica TaxID=1867952 RepID=A0A1C3RH28_9PROT|nr:DUF6134 family protein [Candidatus Terasakiella magnetica]SCA56559.1 conserved exported hypothetical protein [Candidatus Terasakiella magnetica]
MRFITFLLLTLFTGPTIASAINPISLYGERIEFDVVREGEVVGEHITRFQQVDDELRVSSNMNIDIFILFLPVYSFDYRTTEKWVEGKLVSLDVNVVDGSDHLSFKAQRKDAALEIQLKDRIAEINKPVFTTNHWNANVVKDNQVLNTLTGNLNAVTITPKGEEEIIVSNGSLNAQRYDYSGDLEDTSVWYDEMGRWVKLRFLASDGSTIEYRCRTCKAGGAQ